MTNTQQLGTFHLFDTASLHIMKLEVEKTLAIVEREFSDFTEDLSHPAQFDASIDALNHVYGALRFAEVDGAVELTQSLRDLFVQLNGVSQPNEEQLEYASEGLMLLTRYLEFVLHRKALVPFLLLPVTNRIRQALGQPLLREGDFLGAHIDVDKLSTPVQPPSVMSVTAQAQLRAFLPILYRYGLKGILDNSNQLLHFKAIEKAVFFAHMLAGQTPTELFWHTAYCAVKQLQLSQPITDSRKRVLIAIERQLSDMEMTPTRDVVNDVLAVGLCRDHIDAKLLREQLHLTDKITTDSYVNELFGYLFGPNRDTIQQAFNLVYEDIQSIKASFNKTNHLLSESRVYPDVGIQLKQLGYTLKLLNVDMALVEEVFEQAKVVYKLTTDPTEAQINQLMQVLVRTENAMANLVNAYTAGHDLLPFNNMSVSQFQIQNAYQAIIQESRETLQSIKSSISSYLESSGDEIHLINAPDMLKNVAGALVFLYADSSADVLSRSAYFLEKRLDKTPVLSAPQVEYFADIITCIDYFLEGLSERKPASARVFSLSEARLAQLLAS